MELHHLKLPFIWNLDQPLSSDAESLRIILVIKIPTVSGQTNHS